MWVWRSLKESLFYIILKIINLLVGGSGWWVGVLTQNKIVIGVSHYIGALAYPDILTMLDEDII
jgi:hypothetical protein